MWVDWKTLEKCTAAKSLTSSARSPVPLNRLIRSFDSFQEKNPPHSIVNYFLRPKKRLTTQEIELLIFCLFLSRFPVELYWTANACHVFFVVVVFMWNDIYQAGQMDLISAFKTRGCVSLRVTWHSFCFWPERHDLLRRGAFILSCRVENKAAILCQLSSQRTKPSAGWRKTTENRVFKAVHH